MSLDGYIVYDGVSSRDYQLYILGEGTYGAPKKSRETISVPGRNGDLIIDNGRWENITVTYPAIIVDNFIKNVQAIRALFLSKKTYCRLEDTFHPTEFRMGIFEGGFDPNVAEDGWGAKFDIKFNCMPQRFLKLGERNVFQTASSIKNPTQFNALPKIRAYGTGTLTINGITITINSANVYTDIDCELQEAYKGSTSCNDNITLTSGIFPYLSPGVNTISYTGLSSFTITPRYWTI